MSGINETAKVTVTINGSQANQMLADLEKKVKDTEKAIAKLKETNANPKDIEKQRKLLKNYRKELDELNFAVEGVNKAFKSLDTATPRQLEKTIKTLNKQLKDIPPGSKIWDDHIKKIQEANAQLNTLKQQIKGEESLWEKFSKWWFQKGQAVAALVMGYQQFISQLRGYVNDYATMEEAMADTIKFTGLSREDVEELNEGFKKMDTRTPREKLNELAQEAGRLGKNTKEAVRGYVEAADIINVALSELGDGATQEIAKITDIFNVEALYGTRDAMLKVGSTVNDLSQSCTASSNYIVEFTKRLAGVGAQAKMSVPEIMAFAAVLDTQGQKVEMSASALTRTIMMLFQKPKEVAKTVGLDIKEFTDTLRRDTTEGLMMLFGKLKELGEKDALATLSPLFKDLGMDGVRMSSVLAALAEKFDLVKGKISEANKAFEEGNSVIKEFSVFNNTVQAQIDKAKKKLQDLSVELGQKLYPLMSYFISSSSAATKALNILVDALIKHKSTIITLSVAIASYIAVLKAKVLWTKLATAQTALLTKAEKLLHGALAVGKLMVAGMANAVQYLTNGLNYNYAMQQRWRAAMAGMKFAHWTALIIALGTALYALYKRMTEVSAVTKALNKIQEAANEAVAESVAKIKSLQTVIENNNLTLTERYAAIKQLRGIMSEYNATLDEEGRLINHNTALIDAYIKKLRERAIAEATQSAMAEAYKEMVNAGTKIFKPIAEKGDKNGQLLLERLLSGEMDDSYTLERTANWYNFKGQLPGVNVMNIDWMGDIDTDLKENVEKFNEALSIYSVLSSKVSDNFKKSLVASDRPSPQVNTAFAESNKDYKAEADKIISDYNHEATWAAKYGDKDKLKKLLDKRDFLIQKLNP